jgi:hypothetical protein
MLSQGAKYITSTGAVNIDEHAKLLPPGNRAPGGWGGC